MENTRDWTHHFTANLKQNRVDWNQVPNLTDQEQSIILASLQAWQLGETSDGEHLLRAARKYCNRCKDPTYLEAIGLFIKEEQKHGNHLARYLLLIGREKIQRNWGDSLFRSIRYFNSNIELWTLSVITVESTAQIFYQSLKDATNCNLLKQICTEILIDEAYHIEFQIDRLKSIYGYKSDFVKAITLMVFNPFFYATSIIVWLAHRKLFKAGGNNFKRYLVRISHKHSKIVNKITTHDIISFVKTDRE